MMDICKRPILILWNFLGREKFANYLSVADNRDLYVRYLDYLHGGYQIPTHRRMNMGKTSLMNLRASRSPWK